MAARELFLGEGEGVFSPDTSMTRAMFATVLSRVDSAELSGGGSSRFSDIPDGEWYTEAVEWAAENGIVEGVGDGRFDPDAEVTREEIAVMIGRYMRYANYDLPNVADEAAFNDSADISSWAGFDVSIIQQAGIIVGKPGELFDPQGIATRAEVATVFTRFVQALVAG